MHLNHKKMSHDKGGQYDTHSCSRLLAFHFSSFFFCYYYCFSFLSLSLSYLKLAGILEGDDALGLAWQAVAERGVVPASRGISPVNSSTAPYLRKLLALQHKKAPMRPRGRKLAGLDEPRRLMRLARGRKRRWRRRNRRRRRRNAGD